MSSLKKKFRHHVWFLDKKDRTMKDFLDRAVGYEDMYLVQERNYRKASNSLLDLGPLMYRLYDSERRPHSMWLDEEQAQYFIDNGGRLSSKLAESIKTV